MPLVCTLTLPFFGAVVAAKASRNTELRSAHSLPGNALAQACSIISGNEIIMPDDIGISHTPDYVPHPSAHSWRISASRALAGFHTGSRKVLVANNF